MYYRGILYARYFKTVNRNGLEQDSFQILIVEFGPHAQVIVPWLLSSKAITNSTQKVFVPSQLVEPLRIHLKNYHLIADILTTDSIVQEVKKLRFQQRVNFKIIVTSSPESRVPIKTVLAVFYLALISCDVICIRSPREWFYSTRRRAPVPRLSKGWLVFIRVYFLDLVSYFAERLLFIRSRKVVFEHQNMMDFFLLKSKYLATRKPNLVFSGRIQKFNYRLDQKSPFKLKNTEPPPQLLGIGILGTLNPERRDYRQLKLALESLEKKGFLPRVYFLGGHVGSDSEKIIELFHDFIQFAPSNESPYVQDNQILLMESEIDILIAPFSQDWGYTQGKSSGSIADAIYLMKPLIVPSFAKRIFDYEWISYFSTVEELCDLISRFHSLPIPIVDQTEGELTSFLRK